MAHHVARGVRQFSRTRLHSRPAVFHFFDDGDGPLDRRLALHQPALRRGAYDVHPALLPPLFLLDDRPDLSRADGDLSGLCDDPSLQHRLLLPVVSRAKGSNQPVLQSPGDGRGPVVHTELREQVARVGVGGVDTYAQLVGNFLRGESFGHEHEELVFAG